MARTRSIRSGFEQRLLAQLRSSQIAPGDRIVLAFSGGPDSLALAAGLRRVAPVLDLQVLLVHVNHRMRADSDGDARKCDALAGELGFSMRAISLDEGIAERATGIGIEERARRERYLAISLAANEWNSGTILLGHQANDQAETVLLHLFRGAGLQGLAGMQLVETRRIPWWTNSSADAAMFCVVRPLLNETRESIDTYLAELQLQALIDDSNREDDFDRNWVRLHVIPAIEERWPAAIETIARSSQAIRLDFELLNSQAEELLDKIVTPDLTLRTDRLLPVDGALALRIIRNWLDKLGVEETTLDVVARIYDLAAGGDERSAIEAGSNITIVNDRNELTTLQALLIDARATMPLLVGDSDRSWSIELCDYFSASWTPVSVPDGVDLQIRVLRTGDRWFGTHRRVFEDLRSAKIHPQLRNRLLAVTADNGVLLIPAIYPTIRSETSGLNGRQVGVRWWKVDER